MAVISIVRIARFPSIVDPYRILGIGTKANARQTKDHFRKKLVNTKNDKIFRAIICLAYDVMCRKNKYEQINGTNTFKIKEKDAFYFTIVGDLQSLMNLVEEKPELVQSKDEYGRSLLYIAARNGHYEMCEYLIIKGSKINEIQFKGSTPLHGAAYYGQEKVVQLLVNYGANIHIKNNEGSMPIDEAYTDEVKKILKEREQDPIIKLFKTLYEKKLATKIIPIPYKTLVIGQKIICNLKNVDEAKANKIKKEWIPAWHGTNFNVLESIISTGLRPAGGKSKDGKQIEVCINHIDRQKKVEGIPDWANAVFVSPSLFYSAHPAYAKTIISLDTTYRVLVEVRVRPNSYTEHKSTVSSHHPLPGEPRNVEFRIPAKNDCINEKDIYVVSLTFVVDQFFSIADNYEEGNALVNTREEN